MSSLTLTTGIRRTFGGPSCARAPPDVASTATNPAASNPTTTRLEFRMRSSLEKEPSDVEGDRLPVVLVVLHQREAEVDRDGDVAELGDDELDSEADRVAPLLVVEIVPVEGQVAQVVEAGDPEDVADERVRVLRAEEHVRVAADGVAVLARADAAEIEAADGSPAARVEPLV